MRPALGREDGADDRDAVGSTRAGGGGSGSGGGSDSGRSGSEFPGSSCTILIIVSYLGCRGADRRTFNVRRRLVLSRRAIETDKPKKDQEERGQDSKKSQEFNR